MRSSDALTSVPAVDVKASLGYVACTHLGKMPSRSFPNWLIALHVAMSCAGDRLRGQRQETELPVRYCTQELMNIDVAYAAGLPGKARRKPSSAAGLCGVAQQHLEGDRLYPSDAAVQTSSRSAADDALMVPRHPRPTVLLLAGTLEKGVHSTTLRETYVVQTLLLGRVSKASNSRTDAWTLRMRLAYQERQDQGPEGLEDISEGLRCWNEVVDEFRRAGRHLSDKELKLMHHLVQLCADA